MSNSGSISGSNDVTVSNPDTDSYTKSNPTPNCRTNTGSFTESIAEANGFTFPDTKCESNSSA